MTLTKHINAEFDAELQSLKEQILAMGALVDAQVTEAVKALSEHDAERAQRVVEADRAVNQMELAIDERCIRMLALRQPAASDLRFIAAALKMVTDLERIGDLAVNMAELVPKLAEAPPLRGLQDLPGMAGVAQNMLRSVLDAFVAGDPVGAEAVIAADTEMDAWMARLFAEVQGVMSRDPTTVPSGLATISFARQIERLADHATNVAEMVIYLIRGRDVRHGTSA
ncbi:MAG: phosphate signaling complex protein PhoU [Deltaproteobacteria bacterium]